MSVTIMLKLKLNSVLPKRFASKIASTSTADPNELRFFAKLSDDWWNEKGLLRLLLKMNPIRVSIIHEFLTNAGLAHIAYSETKTPLRGLKMLDVGCGGGLLSEALAKLGADVTGVDAGEDLLQIARSHMALDPNLQNLRYQCSLIEDFSQSHRESFDAVISSEVIEHVSNPEMFVKHCAECLRPGGSIIFTTMDRTPPGGFLNIIFHEHIYKIMPKGTHTYSQFVRPKEMENMFKKFGCKTVGVQGFTLNSFTERWYRMPVTWFNYALHAIKGGAISNQVNGCRYAAFSDTGKN